MEIIDLIPFEPSLSYRVLGHVLSCRNHASQCEIRAIKIRLCRKDHSGIADNTFVIAAYVTGRHVVSQTC